MNKNISLCGIKTITNEDEFISLMRDKFPNKEIVIEAGSLINAYKNNLQMIREMSHGKKLFIFRKNVKESIDLINVINTVLNERQLVESSSILNARKAKIRKADKFALANGVELVQLRITNDKRMAFNKMASILNKNEKKTPSGSGQWAASIVERVYKRFLCLNKLSEEDLTAEKINELRTNNLIP